MDSDGFLILLRCLSLGILVALSSSLIYLLVARGRKLPPIARRAWLVITASFAVITTGTVFIEFIWLMHAIAPLSPIVGLGYQLYNPVFLLNAEVDALVPFALLIFCAQAPLIRRIAAAMGVILVLVGVVWSSAGALGNWDTLLTSTQVIAFLGIAAYLTFCGLWVLGRLLQTDAYLIGFVAISTLFSLLLPVQEVFFQLVGRGRATHIWHLNQFLQFALNLAQLGIVLALVNTLARGQRPAPRVPVAR